MEDNLVKIIIGVPCLILFLGIIALAKKFPKVSLPTALIFLCFILFVILIPVFKYNTSETLWASIAGAVAVLFLIGLTSYGVYKEFKK